LLLFRANSLAEQNSSFGGMVNFFYLTQDSYIRFGIDVLEFRRNLECAFLHPFDRKH